jgi:hypothetical protein
MILSAARLVRATGFYGPQVYLSNGGNLNETPEFYWELEVKRLAKDFHPKEKLALVPRAYGDNSDTVDIAPMAKATADADTADFTAAIKDGEIKPPDPAAAEKQHSDARDFLSSMDPKTAGPLPAEFDSEFADYDRGAYAFRLGKDHWDEARKAWTALLDRPASERHYRTVWAAFMLGKLALKNNDPEAVTWFQKTRDLAAQGFADSLGMAADSYGWEGRSQWKQGHPERAAPLFLTQLSLGDDSAIVSLKALIPDRVDVDGMLNYGENGTELYFKGWNYNPPPPTADQLTADEPKILEKLKAMAADPLLRRLETAHILATESGPEDWNDTPGSIRSARWLGVVNAAKLGRVEDAEYLGWVAYTTGNYKDAAHWLDLSTGTSPVANWLRARLDLRAGKLQAAAAAMAAAWQVIRTPNDYIGWNAPKEDPYASIYVCSDDEGDFTMDQWATGDMASIHLLRSDFVQALDTFVKGDLRDDAAYVAERVLTADELKTYVDQMPPPPPDAKPPASTDSEENITTWLRYLLGRRLVREDRYAEAASYLLPSYAKLLGKYVDALSNGANPKLAKSVRADNWSTAAWLARYDGMELMGTEVSPDGLDTNGAFEDDDLAGQRISGKYSAYTGGTNQTLPMPYPPAKAEIARLKKDPIHPDVRFHYRVIAAVLAMRAADLMDNNTEELADAINMAGMWTKDRDEKLANRIFALIQERCPQTKIGQDAITKHWFVDEPGPWSKALQAQEDAFYKQFGIQSQQ